MSRISHWCILVLLSLYSCLALAIEANAPKLKVDAVHASLGSIRQGDVIEYTYQVSNVGIERLTIKQIKTSCGCTVVSLSKGALSAGEVAVLKVIFDSGHFMGKVTKELYLESNDPVDPVTTLSFSVDVMPAVTLYPAVINFGTLNHNESKTFTLKLKNNMDDDLHVDSISLPFKGLSVSRQSFVVPSGETFILEITLKSPPRGEKVSGYIVLNTDWLKQSQLRVPVYGFGASD